MADTSTLQIIKIHQNKVRKRQYLVIKKDIADCNEFEWWAGSGGYGEEGVGVKGNLNSLWTIN
jgi:hypothetical protein